MVEQYKYQKHTTESLKIKINKQIAMNEVRGFFWEVLLSHPLYMSQMLH